MNRRTLLAGSVAVVGAAVGGWYVFWRDDPITFIATQARVSEATLEETGYREARIEPLVVTEEFSAGGETARVRVENWVSEYHRAIDVPVLGEQEAAVFVAFATPEVGVLGRNFNPVEDMDPDEIVELIQEEYDDLRNLERVGEDPVTLLGSEVAAVRYEGEATFAGAGLDIYLHITPAVPNAGEFVLALGVYPRAIDDAENVFALIESIHHPGADPDDPAQPDDDDDEDEEDADDPDEDEADDEDEEDPVEDTDEDEDDDGLLDGDDGVLG